MPLSPAAWVAWNRLSIQWPSADRASTTSPASRTTPSPALDRAAQGLRLNEKYWCRKFERQRNNMVREAAELGAHLSITSDYVVRYRYRECSLVFPCRMHKFSSHSIRIVYVIGV
jgi:hypothetical protein